MALIVSLCAKKNYSVGVIVACIIFGLSCQNQAESKNGFSLDGALIPVDEIYFGGPPKDGIPALDHPKFVQAGRAHFLQPNDRVLALKRNGVAKAYPFIEPDKTVSETSNNVPVDIADELAGYSIRVRYDATHRSVEAFDEKGEAIPGVALFWFA